MLTGGPAILQTGSFLNYLITNNTAVSASAGEGIPNYQMRIFKLTKRRVNCPLLKTFSIRFEKTNVTGQRPH